MKAIEELERAVQLVAKSWSDEVANLQSENDKLTARIAELEAEFVSFGENADAMHDAICEGRRQDAIDALNYVTGGNYRSVAEQHNLFPSRVSA